ncbi:hypothetical protein ACFVYP_13090 [Kitasatospora sp. NPDC058201]|uniref:hypothetical protein n=1 Tax=unclassified Kitasatospora TaxID=2633591 RepID=UPI003648399E
MADEDPQHEDRNERAAAAGTGPPADRSYGDNASDNASDDGDPADGSDPERPDSGPVRQGYDATAESAAAAADPRSPYAAPPADDDAEQGTGARPRHGDRSHRPG